MDVNSEVIKVAQRYGCDPKELRSVIVDRLQTRYNWRIAPEAIVFLPGVVPGFNVACRTFAGRSAARRARARQGCATSPAEPAA